MYIETPIWNLILSYASCVCIVFMWYWLLIYFGIKRNEKEDLETYTFFNKLLLKSSLYLLIIPCIILFIISLLYPQWIEDLWASIVHNITHDTTRLLLLFALSVIVSLLVSIPIRDNGWRTYFSIVYLLIPIVFLISILLLNFSFTTIIIILGFIGLVLSGKIIG